MPSWTPNFQGFLNLFLQSHCPLCQRSTSTALCEYCTRQLKNCGQKNPCASWRGEIPVFGWSVYSGTIKRAIAVMKYENQPQIGQILGEWLGESWLINSPHRHTQPIVIPIPLHPQKQKQRGYNQAALIAQGFCQTTGLKLQPNGLSRVRETKAQFGLSMTERQKNLAEAFTVGQKFRSHHPDVPVLLIDDIYTTGATTKSAVQTFRQSGIAVLGLAAVAIAIKDQQTNS
ncbi:ComF family protein [Nostoc sp. FACHB-152]|uniref:ComF family protein n=1 Tax=unclassified Nostoc TaxID=2593658 RepID=UPI001686AF26|nr:MULTISPECIES: ComF family protein [unclassified Nostoc]MBD2449982.1 ComF family protein [Nostoc sp. FACHB-152]MBD2468426.1 ComF family protein [Nostoc sp. FACHB-145]